MDSVDAALAGQNALLSLKVWAMAVSSLAWVRYKSEEVSELFNLPDYTYPVLGWH